jgi:serine/threonine protein kinase
VKGIPLDARSDVYAMGIALFELLTGQLPFDGQDEIEIGHHHLVTAPPPPSLINPDVGPALEKVILKALEKEKRDRYQSAKEMIDSLLEAAIADGISIPQTANPNTMEKRVSSLQKITVSQCLADMKQQEASSEQKASPANSLAPLFSIFLKILIFAIFLSFAAFLYYYIIGRLTGATASIPDNYL